MYDISVVLTFNFNFNFVLNLEFNFMANSYFGSIVISERLGYFNWWDLADLYGSTISLVWLATV